MGQQARLIPRAGLIVRHAHMRPRVRALPTLHHAADLDGWIATNPRSGAGKWPALALALFFCAFTVEGRQGPTGGIPSCDGRWIGPD
jgi:hypothetical protein